MIPEYGDSVKVQTKEQAYEGIMLPRPEILEEGFTIIKLDNGYNIGIENKNIEKIEVIKKYEKKKETRHKIEQRKGLPLVPILSFGGTISSRVDYKTGGANADYTAEDFVAMVPELKDVANIKAEKVMGIMSEDMTPEDWQHMARKIAKELNEDDVAGVVVTQGTDTLHFSTAAMSFFLKHLHKPVVFTAAQRSIDRGSSDAFSNLLCAVHAASKFDGAAVVTCLHGTSNDDYCILNRGTKVRKMHTSRRDAFRPINELPLAKVFENGKIEIVNSNYNKKNNQNVSVDDKFEEKTGLIYVHPGMNPDILDYYLEKKFKGLVVAATGLGHVSGLGDTIIHKKYSVFDKLKELKDKLSIVIASQTIYGRVHPYVYTNLRRLSIQLNCIFAEDMLPEVAYIKLGWVLGHTNEPEEVRKMVLTNYAGEITDRSDEGSFLY